MKQKIFFIFTIIGLAFLGGCAVATVGAIGAGSMFGMHYLAYRKGPTAIIADMKLKSSILKTWAKANLTHDLLLVLDGRVLIAGSVTNINDYINITKKVDGVRKVIDGTHERISNDVLIDDTLLAARIKTQLFTNKNIQSRNYITLVHAGICYVLGIAYTQEEKDAIIVNISDTPGLQGFEHDIEIIEGTKSEIFKK